MIALSGDVMGIFNDRNILAYSNEVLIYGSLLCLAAFMLWRGITEYRDNGERTAFIPLIALGVIVGGLWLWVGYFGDHGAFLAWPIFLVVVLAVLLIPRLLAVERQRRERAEELQQMPPPPDTGGGPAKQSDFEKWKF